MSTILRQYPSSFGELIGNGKTLEVPAFQRDYSWGIEEWEDLWQDILAIEESNDHYMGYIVLQGGQNEKHHIIIDGQQRITTLSLLILAIVSILKEREDLVRAADIRSIYLSKKDILTQSEIPKLKLNYNNEVMYGGILLQLNIPNKLESYKASERKLVEAYNYFYHALTIHFANKPNEEIIRFLEKKIDTKLFFTIIQVENDINAFKIFETLNARGVKLSTADLFKNYLFATIFSPGAGSISHEERKWHRINDTLGNTDITTYLWHFWNSRFPTCERKTSLFKAIQSETKSAPKALAFLNALHESAPIYAALSNPESSLWNSEIQVLIEELNILEGNLTFSLLMNAFQKWEETEFKKLLRDTISIIFRYHIIGELNPSILEKVFNKASYAIHKGEIKTAKEIFEKHLKEIYISDDSFKNDFQNKKINTGKNNSLAKYILVKLEEQISLTKPDSYSKGISVEHILPENPDDQWLKEFPDADAYIYRMGNLTLLEVSKNRQADRKIFEEKQTIYASSHYKITSQGIDYSKWEPRSVTNRQKEMAGKAVGIWRVNY